MQRNAKYEKESYWVYLSCVYVCKLEPLSVKRPKQTFWTTSPFYRTKLFDKVHIKNIIEATNIILRGITHTKRYI